jgi:hypothetical protein
VIKLHGFGYPRADEPQAHGQVVVVTEEVLRAVSEPLAQRKNRVQPSSAVGDELTGSFSLNTG